MADIEKVIKALEFCTVVSGTCNGCPYDDHASCDLKLKADALELLKEQPKIVRCKDCKYFDCFNGCMSWHDVNSTCPDWFCADGEERTDG